MHSFKKTVGSTSSVRGLKLINILRPVALNFGKELLVIKIKEGSVHLFLSKDFQLEEATSD